jgi:alpha-D-ribose 1-methylphosphonate 5-triphosphate diphosphatase
MQTSVIRNAIVVQPDSTVTHGGVLVAGETIQTVLDDDSACQREIANGALSIDAQGAFLMPGVVDLHNDALEFEINPRPGASLPLPFAFDNLERRLAAAGVTTEFHAISFMDRPNVRRSIDNAAERARFVAHLADGPRRAVDHQVLHRIDVWHPDALETVFGSLREMNVRYASLNDHTPGQGQYRDLQKFFSMREAYGNTRAEEEVRERMLARSADTRTVQRVYHSVAEACQTMGTVLATHDDDSVEKVDVQCGLGATVNEFPVTIEVAEHARARGMAVVVGAPNIVRGGSQSGNLAASELLSRGLADVISADYHAPSLLASAFKVFQCGWATLPEAIRMVSLNAARAVGLHDRGAIPPGLRADLALVRLDSAGFPHVEATFLAGHQVFAYQRSAEPALV